MRLKNPSRRDLFTGTIGRKLWPSAASCLFRRQTGEHGLVEGWQYALFATGKDGPISFRSIPGEGYADVLTRREYSQLCEEMPDFEETTGVALKDWNPKNVYVFYDGGIEVFLDGRYAYIPALNDRGEYLRGSIHEIRKGLKDFDVPQHHQNRVTDFFLEPEATTFPDLFDFETYRPSNIKGLNFNRERMAFLDGAIPKTVQAISRQSGVAPLPATGPAQIAAAEPFPLPALAEAPRILIVPPPEVIDREVARRGAKAKTISRSAFLRRTFSSADAGTEKTEGISNR
jgi:hypothetical protein